MFFSEHCIEIFPGHAEVIGLWLCVVNKFNTSVDVLLLDYGIFLALFLRSDVAEIGTGSS